MWLVVFLVVRHFDYSCDMQFDGYNASVLEEHALCIFLEE